MIYGAVNFPGSWQGSKVAHVSNTIDPLLRDDYLIPKGFAPLYHSAFTAGRQVVDKIVRGRNVNKMRDVESLEMCAIDMIM